MQLPVPCIGVGCNKSLCPSVGIMPNARMSEIGVVPALPSSTSIHVALGLSSCVHMAVLVAQQATSWEDIEGSCHSIAAL